ncbi:MAG: potassium transporter [Bacteroidia bacterium]|nr:MAG: potassium transporter [Bacteroidia bacterium]PIE86448.1 MAG: potassium transporter [Bacteroidia bacterium]
MINKKIIYFILGFLLIIESAFLLLSLIVSLIYGENDSQAFFISFIISLVFGFGITFFNRKAKKNIGKREGYIIVSLVWVIFSLFGSLPFYLSNAIPNITDAFFETMSGFTTTGASILNNIEELPHGILFWRSITQWMGGMGMIVMSLAILPLLGIGGMQLFVAEVPGPVPDKLHPRVKETAKRLWAIYIIFTAAEVVFLMLGGMNFFDAVNHSLTTMATGGYSTKQSSIINFSPYIQYIITLFMFIAGTNFTLSYFALHGKVRKVWENEEFRYYLGFVLGFTTLITLSLLVNDSSDIEKSFRDALFQVVSLITTTGYATADYLSWGHFCIVLSFMVMFFGGSAGSTGGGIKIMRIVLLIKNGAMEFKRLVHPNAIIPVRFNKRAVSSQIITNVLAFFVFYIIMFAFGTVVMAFLGESLDTAMGATIASLGNIGPGIGAVGPMDNFYHLHPVGKWVLSFLMLVGRLELFTVLILLSPSFWKK